MLSLFAVIWAWVVESAALLMDLANVGRDAGNPYVIAVVVIHAIIRVAMLLALLVPFVRWIFGYIFHKDGDAKKVCVWLIILIVASLIFEAVATPTRPADANPDAAITEQAKGGD